jgi:hypothetical protein
MVFKGTGSPDGSGFVEMYIFDNKDADKRKVLNEANFRQNVLQAVKSYGSTSKSS